MYRISKRFSFSASHQIKTLPDSHPCSRLHGHNYEVEVVVEAPRLNEHGFVEDYRDIDAVVRPFIEAELDHRHLNDRLPVTSAEAIAKEIYGAVDTQMPNVVAVRVSETPKTWAEYR